MKATVIVLTYRQEGSVRGALESVARVAEGLDCEILIGEDGSPDRTREVCETFAAQHPELTVRLMPATPNKGFVNNYFDCLEAARGEYIADCAGDDEWLPTFPLREAIGLLDADPTLTAVFSDAVFPDRVLGNPFATARVEGEDMLRATLNHTDSLPYVLSAAVYRKSAVMEVMRECPEIVRNPAFGVEDLPILSALASRGAAAYLPGPALKYTVSPDSISNARGAEKQVRFYAGALECTRCLCEFYGVDQREVREMFRKKARYILGLAWRSGDPDLRRLAAETAGRWSLRLPLVADLRRRMILLKGG